MHCMSHGRLLAAAWLLATTTMAAGEDASLTPAQRGYRLLTEKEYLPPDFDQETFEAAWQHWPESVRSQAEKATPAERRKMAFERYGLTARPDDPTKPLQYVIDDDGNWTMNCFACHGGTVPDGKGGVVVWPGAPNSRFALQTLTEETRLAKATLVKPFSRMDIGSVAVPLGTSNGTTNAVMFGVVLMAFRDADLNVDTRRPIPPLTNHDMDAPPWWHFQRKKQLYIDGFAEKGHRGLMQFMLVKQNGPEKFREWEDDFRDVFAYLSSIGPPKYPYPIDQPLADRGRIAFSRVCAECHGTYGKAEVAPATAAPLSPRGRGAGGEGADAAADSYLEKLVPIDVVGTDRVRLDALTPKGRDAYGQSWFADYGRSHNVRDPGGYVAPPFDGIWASAPYFHNGSVPTLWHVLHPGQRPIVWKRKGDEYDPVRAGPAIEMFKAMPAEIKEGSTKREYFDTTAFGKSAAGHDFPDELTADEKRAVLEYLKSL
ncbi:MAG TPA: cytochrome c [Pirellulaceae bacterium]|nr:cytochrome c [Pirellulaceae bacterium]